MLGRLVLNLIRARLVDQPLVYLAGHYNEYAVAAGMLLLVIFSHSLHRIRRSSGDVPAGAR